MSSSQTDAVAAYYESFDEWGRLDTPEGRLEFERTMALISPLVPVPSRILDLGGGPGRYTIALAGLGHACQLVDLSPRLVREARERVAAAGLSERAADPMEGTATDLSHFSDDSFDAVLALGPFYHLVREPDRRMAMRECARVLRPGGILIAAFIPRLSGAADLIGRAAQSTGQVRAKTYRKALSEGVFENASDVGFQGGFYMEPSDAVTLAQAAGMADVRIVSIRSLLYGREQEFTAIRERDVQLAQAIQESADAVAENAAIVATCGHALILGKRSAKTR